jgi:serine phosphatase RsbU (regulator of sigma subunit)
MSSPHAAVPCNGAVEHVLRRSHLNAPDELPTIVAEGAACLGASEATMYVVDLEQAVLTPLPSRAGPLPAAVRIDGTLPGRAFRDVEPVQAAEGEGTTLWLPMLDGVERLGVLEVLMPGPVDDVGIDALRVLAHLAAELLITNGLYTDHYEWSRRKQPMSLAAEVLHGLLPPLTFGTDRIVISGLLAPAYEVGGDAFDYALNGNIAHVAVFDAVGHGLLAGQMASLALACYRNSRRAGIDLAHTALAIDAALAEVFGTERFVTAVLAQLDIDTGLLRFVNAGHPEPLLMRDGKVVKELTCEPILPLGLNGSAGLGRALSPDDVLVCAESLQPADRLLLVTDGVDEARAEDGSFFGRRRLAEFAARESASGLPSPEVMRRLQAAILRYQVGRLQDDATTLFVEWLTGKEQQLEP